LTYQRMFEFDNLRTGQYLTPYAMFCKHVIPGKYIFF
jgi:hypothetical protein